MFQTAHSWRSTIVPTDLQFSPLDLACKTVEEHLDPKCITQLAIALKVPTTAVQEIRYVLYSEQKFKNRPF